MNIIEEKWDSVVDTLSTEFGFSPISINTWIKPLQVQRYDSDEGTLFIYVPIDEMGINEDFINSYINKKFTTPLRSTHQDRVYCRTKCCKRSGFLFEY